MNRILTLTVNEILLDYQAASKVVNDACAHQLQMEVTGCCVCGETLLITMEECPHPCRYEYVFATFPSVDTESVIGEISSRYFAGFTTIAGFPAGKDYWGLFASPKQQAN